MLKLQANALMIGLGLAAVAVYAFSRAVPAAAAAVADVAGGIVTGDNYLTQNATNADGEQVTAYEGAGIVGTLGAATNAASGGYLASWGESLGGWFYDLTHEEYDPNADTAPRNTGGASGSW